MSYFSKFIIIFQLVLRWIYSVALEIVREKVYIGQLPGLQYKKEISLTSTGHAGNLPYANKTNKLQKIEYFSHESQDQQPNLLVLFENCSVLSFIKKKKDGPKRRGYF